MSKKYVIELDDRIKLVTSVGVTENGVVYTTSDYVHNLEELNSDYINEHFGSLQDDAYKRGLEDGKKEAESSEAIEQARADAFNKGMLFKEEKIHDAFLRGVEKGKAVNDKGCEGCKLQGTDSNICDQCCNSYANQWKSKDDKIEVGDEVEWTGDKYIVTYINYDIDTSEITDYDLLGDDGSVADHVKKCAFTKTGRHFDIQSILEAMKHD